ncbi:hypothetical protein TRIUR3_29042 [Triticum urartu]|uniref:Uncharacterized protein n=1 Tax=Triticum urartu TaxID=4572 RepID=M8AEX9_TRIUA|nr:hypothetical protein TRIUR3_29042 [Triticum urartu]
MASGMAAVDFGQSAWQRSRKPAVGLVEESAASSRPGGGLGSQQSAASSRPGGAISSQQSAVGQVTELGRGQSSSNEAAALWLASGGGGRRGGSEAPNASTAEDARSMNRASARTWKRAWEWVCGRHMSMRSDGRARGRAGQCGRVGDALSAATGSDITAGGAADANTEQQRRQCSGDEDGEADGEDAPSRAATSEACRCRAPIATGETARRRSGEDENGHAPDCETSSSAVA